MALIYFDNNVFAHVNDVGEEGAFVEWLRSRGDRALLSYHHLWEGLAIGSSDLRQARIRLLRSLPCEYVDYPAYLEARDFLAEVRRCRPGWLRRFPDPGQADVHLRFHRKLWRIAEHEDEVTKKATDIVRDMTNARRDHAVQVLKSLQTRKREGAQDIEEMVLGETVIRLGTARTLADPVAWWRRQGLDNWHASLLRGDPGLTDWTDYIGGYLDTRSITTEDFAQFWLDDIRPEAMPRSFVQAAALLAQLDSKILPSGMLDTDHVAAALDADLFVTEDKGLYAVFASVRKLEERLPQPYLARRAEASAVAAVNAVLGGSGDGSTSAAP